MKKTLRDFLRTIVRATLRRLPETFQRLSTSYFYDKEQFLLKGSNQVFKDIYQTNLWNTSESRSGGGSTLEGTKTIREKLPYIIKNYAVSSMLDAPCGDFNWMKTVPKNCQYIGGDIVSEIVTRNQELYGSDTVQFLKLDITKDRIPKVDLIFCKDCLQHLSYESVAKALANFVNSGSKYLLVTSYPKTWRNHDIYDGDYRPLNLFKKPFFLSNPLLLIEEKSQEVDVETDKTMYLFDLQALKHV
jgi:hypothetical protein